MLYRQSNNFFNSKIPFHPEWLRLLRDPGSPRRMKAVRSACAVKAAAEEVDYRATRRSGTSPAPAISECTISHLRPDHS
jgi:hypothetical protein